MDLTAAITPRSDQLNAEDLLTGPRTFTITGVDEGSSEQPVNVHLAEMPGRPWRPSKSMSRVLAYVWGKETTPYAGRRVTLYRDPEVTFGRDKVGGIKISHLSDIDAQKSVSLTVTRGKRAPHVVQPLADAPPPVERMTNDQAKQLKSAFDVAGVEQSQRLGYIRNLTGRDIEQPGDLTSDEAATILTALAQDASEGGASE